MPAEGFGVDRGRQEGRKACREVVLCTWKSRRAWSSFMSTFIIFSRRCTSLKFMRPSLFLSAFWNQSRIHVREAGAGVKGKDHGSGRRSRGAPNPFLLLRALPGLVLSVRPLKAKHVLGQGWGWRERRAVPAGRILVYPLPLVHAGGHLDQLAQALHPALRLLRRASDEVQVAPAAVEDDGEAALGGELLGQALQHLRLVPFPHRLHVADGDWGRDGDREL